jgi:outer membrane protein assembly factor BamD
MPRMTPSLDLSPPARRSRASRALLAVAACLPLVALLLSGCRTNREGDDLKSGPEIIYERASKSLAQQDYDNAIRLYEALNARYPFATEARQARLDLIYAYYKGRETESALDAADTFIRENPTHPRVDYAWYIKGLVEFERTPNVLERFFKVDLNERPPQTARKSFAAFRKVVEDYPKSDYAHDARRRMIHLRNRLADYQLYVARYYMKRGAYIAAAQRAKEAIEQYDGAPAVREALELMVQAYEQLGMKELADQTRQVYAANYGGDEQKVVPYKRPWWKLWG